jgi:FMN-dependent NADH-azoreductase
VGLLKIRKAYLVVASGGTGVGSEIDFATTYLRHVLGFLGIDHIEIVAADRAMVRGDEALASAEAEIGRLSFVDPAPGSVSSREPSEQPVGASS